MNDRSVKYSEEYIRIKIEDLVRTYAQKARELKIHHDEALSHWNKESEVGKAIEAAYREELLILKEAYKSSLTDVRDEFRALKKKFKSIRKDLVKSTLESVREMEFGLMNLLK